MLIESRRYSRDDLERWRALERMDAINAVRLARSGKIERALDEVARFASDGRCYAGVSWGKDSTVIVHMLARLRAEHGVVVPAVWIRVEPIVNPDCVLVRDAFLARFDIEYHEIITRVDPTARRTSEGGFERARERFGDRHISGVRASESRDRSLRMRRLGVASDRACAPLGWWSHDDVFAYLFAHDLPVHPAYACSMNGTLDRSALRVASLGGHRGTGFGRAEWERRYYGKRASSG